MKYYQIYSQCVRTTRPIIELDKDEAYNEIREAVYNCDDVDCASPFKSINWDDYSDDDISKAYEETIKLAFEDFEKYHQFQCGDYVIAMYEDGEEPTRQNIAGYDVQTL